LDDVCGLIANYGLFLLIPEERDGVGAGSVTCQIVKFSDRLSAIERLGYDVGNLVITEAVRVGHWRLGVTKRPAYMLILFRLAKLPGRMHDREPDHVLQSLQFAHKGAAIGPRTRPRYVQVVAANLRRELLIATLDPVAPA